MISFSVCGIRGLAWDLCPKCAQIPDNLCGHLFFSEAPFTGTFVTMSPDVLNLMKCRLDLLLPKLLKAGEYCG